MDVVKRPPQNAFIAMHSADLGLGDVGEIAEPTYKDFGMVR